MINGMKVIKIVIEKHNVEDYYYKEYVNKFFVTKIQDVDKIKEILNSIKTKEYVDVENFCSTLGVKEIDYKDLVEQLKEKCIFPLEVDVSHDYYLSEEED